MFPARGRVSVAGCLHTIFFILANAILRTAKVIFQCVTKAKMVKSAKVIMFKPAICPRNASHTLRIADKTGLWLNKVNYWIYMLKQ